MLQVDIVRKYLYPGCLSISILCLIVTFLLYSVLPQLRDLTGKFILGICGCSVSAFALKLIDIFGAADQNVHNLTTGIYKLSARAKFILSHLFLFCFKELSIEILSF